MCIPIAATAAVSAAVQVGGSIASYAGQKKQAAETNAFNAAKYQQDLTAAHEQRAYAMQVETVQTQYRLEQHKHGNETYRQDIQYGNDLLAYQKSEFTRQEAHLTRATESIQKNYFVKVGTILTRMVEENISSALQVDGVQKTGRSERAKETVKASERGVEGTSVDQIINDISRQEGNAVHVMEMNRSAVQRQLMLEALGLKSQADAAVGNLEVRTFQPQPIPQAPAPPGPVTPAAPMQQPAMPQRVNGPSFAKLMFDVGGDFAQGYGTYRNYTGNDRAVATIRAWPGVADAGLFQALQIR